jgi:hypothetical protein
MSYYDTGFSSDPYLLGGNVPPGPAGGDLTGSYPNPQIASGAITNSDINASAGIEYTKLESTTWTNVQGGVGYANSWVDYGGGLPGARYRKEGNKVHLSGWMKSGTVGATAFTLPSGYRPAQLQGVAVVSNGAFGYLQVNTDGTVVLQAGNNTYASLDNVTFFTDS